MLTWPRGSDSEPYFCRIGGELVQRKPEILHGLGLQHHVLAFDGDLLAEAIGMLAQLLLDQHAQRRAMPIVGDQEIVRAADGDEPRAEAIEEILDRARARGGLPGDGVDHGEQILGAVGQLAQQEAKLILVRLALADVDGDRGRAEDLALLVASAPRSTDRRSACARTVRNSSRAPARLAGLHRLALRRHDRFGGLGRQAPHRRSCR